MKRQYRLVHVGVAAAIAAATVTAIGLVNEVGATTGGGTASVYVPIVPCRLVDTRSGPDNVGNRNSPLQPAETVTFAVWGTNGNCTIPTAATGIATNATAVHPTADSYVTIYPADADPRPTASNLNVVAQQPPTPNQVTVGLSATGAIRAYNNGGTLDLVIDIVGYYEAPDSYTKAQIDTTVAGINAAIAGVNTAIDGVNAAVATKVTKPTGSRTAIYPPAGFAAESGDLGFGIDAFLVSLTSTGCLGERLDLPDGATITKFEARVQDISAAAGITVSLVQSSTALALYTTMASINTLVSGTPGIVNGSVTTIIQPVVDNQVNAYTLRFCGGNNTALYNASITYTLP